MVLKRREKILALATLLLLMVVVFYQAYSMLRGPLSGLESLHAKAAADVERKKTRLKNAKLAEKRMEKWRRQSLPSDSRTAQSLYQNWLLQLARDASFSDTKIDTAQVRRRSDVYSALQFTLQAKTTLGGITNFLYRFYSTDHLHQILNLTVTPEDRGKMIKIQMAIEALSLSGAKSINELSRETSERKLAAINNYEDKIVARNLFAAYQPPIPPSPPPPPPPPKAKFDALKFAYLTGVTLTGDRPKIWIIARTTGDRHELNEGDTFEIGETKCKVLRIGKRDAEIEIDGKRCLVSLGQNLRDAEDLSPRE
ncbi:MAG: hypothetical protein JXM70_06160 [Pirellulales bacterium]|nr:hypothetical protein [Pirellulales bacterium]